MDGCEKPFESNCRCNCSSKKVFSWVPFFIGMILYGSVIDAICFTDYYRKLVLLDWNKFFQQRFWSGFYIYHNILHQSSLRNGRTQKIMNFCWKKFLIKSFPFNFMPCKISFVEAFRHITYISQAGMLASLRVIEGSRSEGTQQRFLKNDSQSFLRQLLTTLIRKDLQSTE